MRSTSVCTAEQPMNVILQILRLINVCTQSRTHNYTNTQSRTHVITYTRSYTEMLAHTHTHILTHTTHLHHHLLLCHPRNQACQQLHHTHTFIYSHTYTRTHTTYLHHHLLLCHPGHQACQHLHPADELHLPLGGLVFQLPSACAKTLPLNKSQLGGPLQQLPANKTAKRIFITASAHACKQNGKGAFISAPAVACTHNGKGNICASAVACM